MHLYLTMPKPGETIREGIVVQWLKKEGNSLEEKDPLVELETEKAVFIYESPFRGVLKQILVKEGDETPVGSPLALFEVSQEDGARYLMLGVGLPVSPSAPIGAPLATEGSPRGMGAQKTKTDIKPAPEKTPTAHSPLIRNLAKEHGLSQEKLDQIPGSGPGGRLTKEDVLAYVKKGSPLLTKEGLGEVIRGAEGDFVKVPLSPIRQRIAKHLVKSHAEIPQAASSVDVDMTAILRFKKEKGAAFSEKHSLSLTPFYFFLYAVREALKKFPGFNASYIEEGGKGHVRLSQSIHLGFAVATPQGLINPVIHHAEVLSFSALAKEASRLEKKAKEGKLSVEELTGASFALNNPGAYGGVRCYQLIPSPLSAIIGLNRIQRRPWVVGEKIEPREIAVVDLSFDHRLLDGADAIQFVEAVRGMLENFPFEVVNI